MITKPLLAGKADLDKVVFPVLATPKLDGIRALVVDGKLVSRTFKPIPNDHIRETLEAILPDGADGEIMIGTTFQECTSGTMRKAGTPAFRFCMFDLVDHSLDLPYSQRMERMKQWYDDLDNDAQQWISLLLPSEILDHEHLNTFESQALDMGYEGVMIRKPDGRYKCGRSTANEGILLKIKRFTDSEAEVIGFVEEMHNGNEATVDAFGRTERSSHKENKTGKGTLGAFVVRDLTTGLEFHVGTGLDAEQRREFWHAQDELLGSVLKYKFFAVGVKELPRHPVFLGFRSLDDM